MLRILPQHQHTVIHQSDVADAFNLLYLRSLGQSLFVKDLKEGSGCKITHLIGVFHDIDGFSENLIPIFFISFFCQRIIAQLIWPEIKLWIAASVKKLHREHEKHIGSKEHAPGPDALQIKLFFHSICQLAVHPGQKQQCTR